MATFEFARFKIDPTQADQLVERWRAAVAAIRTRFPGLIEANLARIDDTTFVDVWRWETHEAAMAAAQGAPDTPEAASMFSLIAEPPLMEHGDIIEQA
jgi:heme-degrading monooxygenase HmoA